MTQTLDFIACGDGAWPDLANKHDAGKLIHIRDSAFRVTTLDMGMASGRPSVAIRIDLPDGRVVLFETSARIFYEAARLIEATYPGLFDGSA